MVNSLIDYIVPKGKLPLQRIVDNFDGDALDERWTIRHTSGYFPGTTGMSDVVDDGFKITNDVSSTGTGIDFNDIRQYANDGSVFIAETKTSTTGSYWQIVGLTEQDTSVTNTAIYYNIDTSPAFQTLKTSLNGTITTVNTSQAPDEEWHRIRGELRASSATLELDDILEAVSTSNLPDVALQPCFQNGARTNSDKTSHIRYYEAYNT